MLDAVLRGMQRIARHEPTVSVLRRVSGTSDEPIHGLDGTGAAGRGEVRAGKHSPFFA